MKIAFGKSLRCIVLISFLAWKERVCLLEVFLIQYKCCIETRFSRCSSQEFAGFTVIVWVKLSEYVDPSREIFQGEIFFVMLLYQVKIYRSSGDFLCEKFPSLLYLLVSKFVFRFWAHRQRVAVVDVIVTWKREPSQGKIYVLICGGLGNFPQKIFAQRKFPDKLSLYQ